MTFSIDHEAPLYGSPHYLLYQKCLKALIYEGEMLTLHDKWLFYIFVHKHWKKDYLKQWNKARIETLKYTLLMILYVHMLTHKRIFSRCLQTFTHPFTHARAHTNSYKHIQTNKHVYIHTRVHVYTHKHTRARSNARTHYRKRTSKANTNKQADIFIKWLRTFEWFICKYMLKF